MQSDAAHLAIVAEAPSHPAVVEILARGATPALKNVCLI